MKVEQVKQLAPLERFLYWIQERYAIYKRRNHGRPKPWSDDRVFQTVFFTMPYRELDRTTVWFRENLRDILNGTPDVLFATVAFRWFNRIETAEVLIGKGFPGIVDNKNNLFKYWNEEQAINRLQWVNKKQPVFTGAYMIKAGNGPPGCKIPNVCRAISNVWEVRKELTNRKWPTLQSLWKRLKQFYGLGGFMAYEIVCDLRYTHILEHATDVDTWAHLGPGATRGLQRLSGVVKPDKRPVRLAMPKMVYLLNTVRKKLKDMPHFEMREIEHSLCEYDKYERALFKQGKLKRMYNGT